MSNSTAAVADLAGASRDTNSANLRQPEHRYRVRRACDYCRSKRLKCTADRRPCMNCQLYGAECISVPEVPGARKRRSRAAAAGTTGHAPHAANNASLSSAKEPEIPRRPSGHSEGADGESIEVTAVTSVEDPPAESFLNPGPFAPFAPFAFENVIGDAVIDFSHEFWDFDDYVTSSNQPSELAAAEQLLGLQSPPVTDVATGYSSLPRASTEAGVGRIFGAERLASQPTSSLGTISAGIFHRKDIGNSLFLGFTSTAAVLALCVREAREAHRHLTDSESLRFIVDCGPMCDEISCASGTEGPSQQIPSTTLAAQFVSTFFEDYHASNPLTDRSDIGRILDRYVCNGHQSLDPLDRSILYLVTALGACSRSSTNNTKSVNIENLYALAWNLFPHAVAAPSLASVQILLLHVLYNIHWSKWSIAWVLCGIAARTAQSVGLHLMPPQDFGLEKGQLKLRARLWAVTMILDAHLSISQGRPMTCQTSQYDAEMLSTRGGLLHVAELRWPLSEVLTWRVALAQIQQKLNKAFSTVVTSDQRLSCLEEVDLDLLKWKEELPLEFRPEQQTIMDSDAHIDIYMLHLDYFNLLQTIHWCLVKHRSGANIKDHAVPRLRASESICLGACLALVRTLNAMTDGDTRARSFRSRSDHFLSAMAIVYRDISRDPGKLSARTNLEYLRVIKLQLGRMAKEHLLAASLTRLIENMVNSAEQLVREYSKVPL